jgi:hypothetical protein
VVSEFLQPIHKGMDDGQDGLLRKGTGSTWQGRVLHLETIIGESAELRILNGRHLNADESYFWSFL